MEHSNSEDWASTAWHTKASASSSLIPCSGLVTAGRLLGWHNQSGYPNRGMSLAPGGQPWLLNHDYTPAVSRSQAELRFTRQHDFASRQSLCRWRSMSGLTTRLAQQPLPVFAEIAAVTF